MSISGDRVARKTNGVGAKANALDDKVESDLFDALSRTLDSIVIGVIIVADQGRILHANQAAQRMLEARSPISSLGGCLGASQGELTKDLRLAIATAQTHAGIVGAAGIGVPLVDKNMIAATAHVLPLACGNRCAARSNNHTVAAVFVTPSTVSPADIGTVARIWSSAPPPCSRRSAPPKNLKGEKMLDKMSARCTALSVDSGPKKYIDGTCVLADADGDKIFSTFDTRDLDKSQPEMDCGTHIITGGTGKYAGITGSEPFACVTMPNPAGGGNYTAMDIPHNTTWEIKK